MQEGGAEDRLPDNESEFGKTGERRRNLEDRHPRLAKVDGLVRKAILNKDGRVGVKPKNIPARSECGNTDHFKAQCPLWVAKKKSWTSVTPTSGMRGGGWRRWRQKAEPN